MSNTEKPFGISAWVLTTLEAKVYDALVQNAEDAAGGDFGFLDEVDVKALGLTKQQFGALVTTLQTKGAIRVWPREKINGEYWVQQFTIVNHD